MEITKQLEEWVKGNSLHNEERDECCPDFSCCKPELLAPLHEREAFARFFKESNETGKMEMLMGFLLRLTSAVNPVIKIISDEPNKGNA